MTISENHLKKLVELFQNEDFSFTMDAISIIESLIYTEEDFRELLEKIDKKKISEIPTIEELRNVFGGCTTEIQNYLGLWALGTLAQWNIQSLQYLDLSENQLTSLPDSIGNITNLTELYLYYNQLTSLPDSIENLTNLTELNLSSNELRSLPDSIGNLKNLTKLALRNNQLTSLPDSIGNLSDLIELDLSNNPLPQPERERIRKLLPNCEITFDD
jgi:Leucine-rich repeat (LRR) protein